MQSRYVEAAVSAALWGHRPLNSRAVDEHNFVSVWALRSVESPMLPTICTRHACHHSGLCCEVLRTRQRSGARSRWRTNSWRWSRPRSCSRCCGSRRRWSGSCSWRGRGGWCSGRRCCGSRSWRAAASRCLNRNHHGRTCLEEAHRCIGLLWRLIGVESKIIQGTPANCVGVLVLRKRFAVPGNGACVLNNIPWCAAISSISLGAIMCPARMLGRRVEFYIANGRSG